MDMLSLIRKKREKRALTKEEIEYMVSAFTAGKTPDYQMSAFLMAVIFNGMSDEETSALTLAMARSGDTLDLSRFEDITGDKHSTGGVGDKTSLIVGPVVASCGVVFAKMSGRGLGHTGGTVDKLEAIKGYKTSLSMDEFLTQAESIGIALIGQTGNFTPADKKLYALRDVTDTVDSIPLIVSSIMSKKIAAGAKNIVLDVKYGSGAFMKTLDDAVTLASKMVEIGKRCGRNISALISDMDTPLGYAVGNSLEVKEAVDVLRGADIPDLKEVSTALAGEIISLAKGISFDEGKALAEEALASGRAYEKFIEWTLAQGADEAFVRSLDFPCAKTVHEYRADASGYITHIDAESIGRASLELGAGRKTKDDTIDLSAGIVLTKKTGDTVERGEVIAYLHTNDSARLDAALGVLASAYTFGCEKPEKRRIVEKIIR